jgi:hypothetical protein
MDLTSRPPGDQPGGIAQASAEVRRLSNDADHSGARPTEATAARPRRSVVPAAVAGVAVAIGVVQWMLRGGAGPGETAPPAPPRPSATPAESRRLETPSPPPSRPSAPGVVPSPALQPATPVDPPALRRAEDLLALGQYAEAEQLIGELLGADPSEPRLRGLQERLAAETRRAGEDALAQAQQARAEAGIAAGADLARGPFEGARRREAEGARLARLGRWAEARVEWLEAARLFQEAEDQAWVEGARQRYEQARGRAVDAGAARAAPAGFAEAQAAASRAQAAHERHDLAAAVQELESATAALDAARAAALEAAAAQRRAAALEADRQAIAEVLAGYASALEAKDLPRLKSLWPALGEAQEAKIRESFLFAQTLDVGLEILDVRIQGDRATADCRRRDRIVTDEGQKVESDRRAVIRLERGPDGWVIRAIQ